MSATTVPPISSAPAEPEPSPGRATLELDLRLRHPQQQQQQSVATNYTAASVTTPKSTSRRPWKPPPQKKQPQRGLGVAQLERLRLQERWKKLIEVPGTQKQHPCSTTAPLSDDPQAVPHFQYLQAEVTLGGTRHPLPPPPTPFLYPVVEGVGGCVLPQCETGGRCLPPGFFGMGRGLVVGNSLSGSWDGVNNGATRELSSMPNARALVPDHINHDIYLAAGMNGKVKPVVGVVVQYEFFPGKRCRNTWNEAHCMPTVGRGGGRGGTSDSAAASEASNSIDLSLKL